MTKIRIRRINVTKDMLEAMEEARAVTGMSMEEAGERAGVADRYWPKVVAGRESPKRRKVRREMKGHQPPRQPTIRFPFKMESNASYMLEAVGLAIVVMPLDEALNIVDPDPVSELEIAKRQRLTARTFGEK